MDQDQDTLIIQRIKDPWKLMFVDLDIGMGIGLPVALGMAAGFAFSSLAIGGVVGYYWHRSRENNPRGFGIHRVWWHLPDVWSKLGLMTCTPPSYMREFVG
jgi:type IV conjugative transfer system protein TraL